MTCRGSQVVGSATYVCKCKYNRPSEGDGCRILAGATTLTSNMFGFLAGFPEPTISATSSTASQEHEYNVEKTDQELERQPMLEAIPWEPHNARLGL